MPIRSHDQSKGFAFITAPHHVTNELIKLNGVQFQGRCLILEEARSRRKSSVRSNPHSRPHVFLQKMKIPSQGTTLFLLMSLMQILINMLKDL